MDLRVSVVLLFIFLTGGYSLKCYSCSADENNGICEAKVETCPDGNYKCGTSTVEKPLGSPVYIAAKACANECESRTDQLPEGGKVTTYCCDTDLCNAADGVYKGSFLLLLSPLLFYFLFQ